MEPHLLQEANRRLNIHSPSTKKLVFVYSAPKVGSTSIVSALRIFGSHALDIIHVHDEDMMRILGHVEGVTVNQIIQYNKAQGRDVYVIDVYRSPIERKISAFFEKIGSWHFNNTDEAVNQYPVELAIRRFNHLFPHLANGDHFLDRYDISVPPVFDTVRKYMILVHGGIRYIKLRLCDSDLWGTILGSIFGFPIRMVHDYTSQHKAIKDLHAAFCSQYRIPITLLDQLAESDSYLRYFYSSQEREAYLTQWRNKSTMEPWTAWTASEFALYEQVSMENAHIEYVQREHYMDEGCGCKACSLKRAEVASKLMRGITPAGRIIHNNAKTEWIEKRVQKNRIQVLRPSQTAALQTKKPLRKSYNKQLTISFT